MGLRCRSFFSLSLLFALLPTSHVVFTGEEKEEEGEEAISLTKKERKKAKHPDVDLHLRPNTRFFSHVWLCAKS